MHCDSSYAVLRRVGELQRRAHGKLRASEAWARLSSRFCRSADLVVPGFDGFQGICIPLLQLSLANDPKECAEQSPLEILSLAHNHDVYVGSAVGLPR